MNSIVIQKLKESAALHVAAIVVYQQQAIHLKEWGYGKLAARIELDSKEEAQHLTNLLTRLEFIDEGVDLPGVESVTFPRHDVALMLQSNLDLERKSAELERTAIAEALAANDEGTAEVFRENLQGSEDGVQAFKSDLLVIQQIGLQNFLTAQI
jgi:bacterioferritin